MTSENNYLDFEEDYFSQDSRTSRKERKRISNKDRSKFKKSDQDQLKKQGSDIDTSSLSSGRILAIAADGILVDCEGQEFICTLKGALKKEKNQLKNLIAVGDIVWFEENAPLRGSIVKIRERTSILSRADNLSRIKEQLIAVNVDQVIITCSVVAPPLKLSLIDRYIIAAKKGNMEPILVINKIDLLQAANGSELLETEKQLFEEFLRIYRSLNLTIIATSAETQEGIEDLKAVMRGKTSVFSGQSGVGKSRLITLITGLALPTGEIVKKTLKGSHTTTTTHLIPFGHNSFCIDTPGIKSFGLWDLKNEEIKEYFSEIAESSAQCKFLDCLHLNEPDCAVKKAVEEGRISHLRFDSYCALMASFDEEHGRR